MGMCKRSWDEVGFVSEVKESMKIVRLLQAGWIDGLGCIKKLVQIGVPVGKAHEIVKLAVNG